MVQFYFLSIVSNLLAGLALSADYLEEKFPSMENLKGVISTKGSRATIGVVSVISGFFKLLAVTAGDVPVVGDFLPALGGLGLGGLLLYELYRERSTVEGGQTPESVDQTILRNKPIIGIFGILVGLIHFLFPRVLFL